MDIGRVARLIEIYRMLVATGGSKESQLDILEEVRGEINPSIKKLKADIKKEEQDNE